MLLDEWPHRGRVYGAIGRCARLSMAPRLRALRFMSMVHGVHERFLLMSYIADVNS